MNFKLPCLCAYAFVTARSLALAFQRAYVSLVTPVSAFQGQEVVPLHKSRMTM